MEIESYSFGSMKVDGKTYRSDLIIFPGKIQSDWWRKNGHSLAMDDLNSIIEFGPEVLVIGCGAMGVMKVPEETKKLIKAKGIEVIAQRTGEAYKKFNELIGRGRKVVGAFHLTC